MAGTGWKMNHRIADAQRYAAALRPHLPTASEPQPDIFVLPPFTALAAAAKAFAGTPVQIGGQNMHWDSTGAWTGEVSAPMLVEVGCRYVELAHSERLQHFGESYDRVRLKVDAALAHGLMPILCVGETEEERAAGQADLVLAAQLEIALAETDAAALPQVVLAYEPRWAIGAAEAASPTYAEARHRQLRATLAARWGAAAADRVRILYGGSVTVANGAEIIAQPNIDGLFVGRAAWTPEGFARIIEIVTAAMPAKEPSS
jgi:triosephosphate isomerase